MNNITGIIITLNEEENIRECIFSLQQICNEIVVVDSESTDKTREIAEELGAKVYLQPYLGDGFQKNAGIKYATNPWIFSIDADERLTPELVQTINALDLNAAPHWGYAVRRRNYIGSRWIRCCGWYPDYLVRLFRADKLQFSQTKQHAAVPPNNTRKLQADIIHYTYNNIGELFSNPTRNYSKRSAKIMYLNGKKANAFSPIYHGFWAFVGSYFAKGGLFGGVDGLTVSISFACSAYLKYAKLLEYQRDPAVREKEDFDKIW
ncbi:MAG: glycosyltransferase family 2 protein [Lentimicrobiaceae bacterium]|nr:glycosyltransferase family 2 protein [Lentimicrobiaceae bacterium]